MCKVIAITGHTSGIGYALKNHYQDHGHKVLGFSRTNGYDITLESDRKKILTESESVDIFINNAYDGFAQTHLLIDLYKSWYNLEKTIINIGSQVTDRKLPIEYHYLLNYQAHKISLKEMVGILNDSKLKVIYKSFGYVGTEKILQKYPQITSDKYITIEKAVEIIVT
jgi:nucleoside-diphosphate-sugar epimerase